MVLSAQGGGFDRKYASKSATLNLLNKLPQHGLVDWAADRELNTDFDLNEVRFIIFLLYVRFMTKPSPSILFLPKN